MNPGFFFAYILKASRALPSSARNMESPIIPASTALDSDELVEALETARTVAEQGKIPEVQTWLMNAASAARRQGRGARAGEIARAAAGWSESNPVTPELLDFETSGDDFQDETIVDQKAKFSLSDELPTLELTVPKEVVVSELQQQEISARVRRAATPAVQAKGRVRIALRQDENEEYTFRVLNESDKADEHEKEAFLELESGEFSFES